MAINLKDIPAPAETPRPPKWWRWLLFLIGLFITGGTYAIFISSEKIEVNAAEFWENALALPFITWIIFLLGRLAWYNGQLATAREWNKRRERIIFNETLRGRRYLSILEISLHSALRDVTDSNGDKQRRALQEKRQALKTQPPWKGHEGVKHSRLPAEKGIIPEQLLHKKLTQILEELAQPLAAIPADVQLNVLMEYQGVLTDEQSEAVWQQCLAESQIRQPVIRIEGEGLGVIDRWLDESSHERSLLLIISSQIAPEKPDGTAEVAVGLLLGNPEQSFDIRPRASLHRPEQVLQISDLQYGIERALDWVPLTEENVTHGWLTGVDASWNVPVASTLNGLNVPLNIGRDLHNLNYTLGYPGGSAPWLAISCAAVASGNGQPQLIFSSHNHPMAPLWITIVSPA
ncbi:hypothetical protein [Intestinirhabdus alba]|jgi:hypothetical protein|uniref:Uncharacterized protein n=1 Tax=Intestinirhabdus alba TaxID=2899544 RepID=A0A6L6IVQ0_9ENTR|nr:hypothetical protein [Intestinirhabdus alba]MTH48813.1 hypothetical protein [Intestinirhabdus alba]